ncbi:hypothetical protein F4604DRAFT_1996201 [Suillus subluteus]|nr:hypothetical protein F4604DRAFT_1996201 [Suillus subluteus]
MAHLLSPPIDHVPVHKYIESGSSILAFGIGVRKGTLFGPNHDFGSLLAAHPLYISFSTAIRTSTDVSVNDTVVSVSKLPACSLDPEAHILCCYVEENAPASILYQSGLVVMWNCTPPLPNILLSQSLSALAPVSSGASRFVVAVDGESQRKCEPLVFEDANDDFHFHSPSFLPEDSIMYHPILELITKFLLKPESQTRSTHDLRSGTEDTNTDTWRIGEALIYDEAVSCTQTMFDEIPSFLRALPSPIISLATVQLMSLEIRVGLKGSSSVAGPIILPSNLIFIEYLYVLAIIDACHVLDPASEWAHKVHLKWPNDIYGLFQSSKNSPASKPKSTPESQKMGRILVNTSFGGGVADIVIGSGLNVLNATPIASLAQLASTSTPGLSVQRVAVLTSFERIWSYVLQNEEQGFQPFMD